jgi:hypothetical protein
MSFPRIDDVSRRVRRMIKGDAGHQCIIHSTRLWTALRKAIASGVASYYVK